MRADPQIVNEMEADYNIPTFCQDLSDDLSPAISFYITLTQPVRVKVKQSDDPNDFSKRLFYSFYQR